MSNNKDGKQDLPKSGNRYERNVEYKQPKQLNRLNNLQARDAKIAAENGEKSLGARGDASCLRGRSWR
jgi:hypothetical protein